MSPVTLWQAPSSGRKEWVEANLAREEERKSPVKVWVPRDPSSGRPGDRDTELQKCHTVTHRPALPPGTGKEGHTRVVIRTQVRLSEVEGKTGEHCTESRRGLTPPCAYWGPRPAQKGRQADGRTAGGGVSLSVY